MQVALFVFVVGSALSAFLPTFVRQLRLSKASEAAEHLALMHQRTAAYFATEHKIEGGSRRHCLPGPAGPTPSTPQVEPVAVAFDASPSGDGRVWAALGFAPSHPVRFSYTFEPTLHGCDLRSAPDTYLVTFRAQGDLDGDGERSMFERRATVNAETNELEPIGILYVRDRVE